MAEFLAMDGFAAYVWSSFVLALVALAWMVVDPWLRHRRLLQRGPR